MNCLANQVTKLFHRMTVAIDVGITIRRYSDVQRTAWKDALLTVIEFLSNTKKPASPGSANYDSTFNGADFKTLSTCIIQDN